MLNDILIHQFKTTVLECDTVTLAWALDAIENVNLARKCLAEANRVRAKYGKTQYKPEKGNRLA